MMIHESSGFRRPSRSYSGRFAVLLVGFLLLFRAETASAADESFQTTFGLFLQKHCISCHGAEKQEAQVRFDTIEAFKAGDRHLWTMVHTKIASGEMPPKSRTQPADADKRAFLTWIEQQQRALGTAATRRLNRREVAAALRDVTGLNIDYAHALPGDGTVAGFDTGAEGLQDAADGVAQWMRITRRAVDGIRFLEPTPGVTFAVNFRDSKDPRKAMDEWKNRGAQGKPQGIAKPGMGLLVEPRAVGDRDAFSVQVPPPTNKQGIVRVTLVVSVMKPLEGLPNPRLWVEIGGKDVDFREITATFDHPHKLVYEVQLDDLAIQNKGIGVSLSNKVEIPYAVKGFENEDRSNPKDPVPGGTGLFRPTFDRRTLPPEKQPAPFIVLQHLEIEPSYTASWPPADWKANVGEVKDDLDSAKKLLALWTERAWRRPVSEAERGPFLKLYQKLRTEKASFDEAMRAAFQSILMSAPFRYLPAPNHSNPTIVQHTIASRLSFMLLGEPPDAELRKLAANGKLLDPAVLDAQVDRLLADRRSDGFSRPFVTQWLVLDQPITIAQDHIQKQDFRFARYMKASMREETLAYFAQMLKENRPAREIVSSDWTMMNDILAIHYDYPPLEGGALRQVKLKPNDPRGGGILGHAGIQSMLCWMGENWVIYRGAWALRHVLDKPPPPPPLEVPELNPSDGKNKGKSFKELLKQHQQDSRCSVCHKNIDPVGFAFQSFDISGRWRDVEYESYARGELDGRISWKGVGKTRPVDTIGHLPRGENFKTFAEFKELLVMHYQADLVRGLLKNFVIYGTGRQPDVADMKEMAAIMKEQDAKGYPLRDLVKAIVRSSAFLGRD